MKPIDSLAIVLLVGALSITGCGGDSGLGDDGGAAGEGGAASSASAGGSSGAGGNGGGDAGGAGGGEPYQVCTLGLCMEDPDLGAECQETYDACVGRGHYPRSCRMDADMTCGVFGETGPY